MGTFAVVCIHCFILGGGKGSKAHSGDGTRRALGQEVVRSPKVPICYDDRRRRCSVHVQRQIGRHAIGVFPWARRDSTDSIAHYGRAHGRNSGKVFSVMLFLVLMFIFCFSLFSFQYPLILLFWF